MDKTQIMEPSRKDTKMIQALSVLAMVWLHLFDTWDYVGKFTPVIYLWGGIPLCIYIAQLCDFCVFGFAFCSGFGHYYQSRKDDFYSRRLKGLFRLMVGYWIIIVLFSIVSIFVGQADFMPGDIYKLLRNALTIDNSYNGAWWYLFTYIVLVVLSPIIIKIINRSHWIVSLGIGFFIYTISYYLRFRVNSENWFLLKIGPLGMTFFEYMLGMLCCKYKIFSRMYSVIVKISPLIRKISVVIILGFLLYARTCIIPSLFVAPVSGFIIITFFYFWKKPKYIQRIMLLISKHSTNIWLVHMFFYNVLFKGFAYIAKYPLLIFLLIISISMIVSWNIIQLQDKLYPLWEKKGKK